MILLNIAAAAAAYTAPIPVHRDTWVSAYLDFPARGVAPETLTVVSTDITVNPYGGMSGCSARVTHGNPNMAEYVCDVLKNRTEFKPARDPTGKRMWGVYRQTFSWWQSRDKPPPKKYERPAEFQLDVGALPPEPDYPLAEIQFAVDIEGNGSSCTATEERTNQEFAVIACERLEGRIRVPPATDRRGRPVPSVQIARVKFVADNGQN